MILLSIWSIGADFFYLFSKKYWAYAIYNLCLLVSKVLR